MFKRVALFLLTNLLVIATLSLVTTLLGLHGYLTRQGIDYQSLALFCAIWGTGGAFISLFISKWIAKTAMGVKVIDPHSTDPTLRQLVQRVHALARKAGLSTLPEVGIYHSPEVNAFATGPSKNHALVAASTGLLESMNDDEIEGVLGHEVTHIANGDMVTMTLIQGVVNAFALFLSRILAYALSAAIARGEDNHEGPSALYMVFTIAFDILFSVLGTLVVAAFSRAREYRADAGGAHLAGKESMIAALKRLETVTQIQDNRAPSLAELKISHPKHRFNWFSTHPSLEDRIARLQGISQ